MILSKHIYLRVLVAVVICLSFNSVGYCTDDSFKISQRTNQAAVLNNKGLQLKAAGKLQESRTTLEQACLLDPNSNSSIVHENLALVLKQLGELNLACNELSKASAFGADRPTILYDLAACYSELGQISQAIVILQNFLDKYPNDERVRSVKKMLLSLQNSHALKDDPSAADYFPGIRTTNGKVAKWSFDRQPIKVYIESGKKMHGYKPEFKEILMGAFDQWISVVKPSLSWTLTQKKREADIICGWSNDRNNFQQPNGAELGETRLKYLLHPTRQDCEIKSVQMTLCTMNVEGTKALTNEQMNNLCLHEVGHALGISGHSSNHNDVMFLMPKDSTTQLTDRDKATLTRLY